jgi:hypothetical protein
MDLETRAPIIIPLAHPSLNAYADQSNRSRHVNSHVIPRPLTHTSHRAVTGKVYGTPASDPVVLKLNKLTRPMIARTKAVSTTTTTTIIEEGNKRWGSS